MLRKITNSQKLPRNLRLKPEWKFALDLYKFSNKDSGNFKEQNKPNYDSKKQVLTFFVGCRFIGESDSTRPFLNTCRPSLLASSSFLLSNSTISWLSSRFLHGGDFILNLAPSSISSSSDISSCVTPSQSFCSSFFKNFWRDSSNCKKNIGIERIDNAKVYWNRLVIDKKTCSNCLLNMIKKLDFLSERNFKEIIHSKHIQGWAIK